MSKNSRFSLVTDSEIGEGTIIHDQVNLYKCKIGKNCKIGSFVFVEEAVIIGNCCKVKPFVFIPTGVIIEDHVFIGPNVTFTNDRYPKVADDWQILKTTIREGASLGANSVVLPGLTVGKNALVGAGCVVVEDVPENAIVVGNPSRIVGYRR